MVLRKQSWLFAAIIVGALATVCQGSKGAQLRVTTWNLDWFPNGSPKEAQSAEQQRRIQGAADVLRGLHPDIILLQEIRDYEVAQTLADTIKPGAYQIAICSAFKEHGAIARQQVVILAKQPAQAAWAESWKSMEGVDPPRGFAFAWFKINGADVGVYCVHLKSNLVMRGDKALETAKNIRKREVASQQLLDHIKTVVVQKMPAVRSLVIGGDFNTNADEFANETTLTALERDGFHSCMDGLSAPMRITHPGSHGYPDTTFDYFFAKGAILSKPEIIHSQASDHLPVTCTVSLGNETGPATSPIGQTTSNPPPVAQPSVSAGTENSVVLTKPVSIQIPYGSTVLPRGTRLEVVSRNDQTITIRYMDSLYEIPVAATN